MPVAVSVSVPVPGAPTLYGMLTVVWPPADSGTDAGTVPQVTPPAPVQLNVKVLFAEPVFCTVNVSLYPPVFAVRVGAAPLSGVTATPYDTIGTE